MSDEEHRAEILRLLKGAPGLGVTGLAERIGTGDDEVERLLGELARRDRVRRDGDRWIVVEPAASETDEPLP